MADPFVCIRRGFSAHQELLPRIVALLTGQQQVWRDQGHAAKADRLAQMAASDRVVRLAHELEKKRRGTANYLRPTMAALFWRDLPFRRLLQKHPRHKQALRAFRWAAYDEAAARAICAAAVVSELAEMATQPDERAVAKVAERARAAVEEWQTAEALRAFGLPDEAAGHMHLAFMHLSRAHILAREWRPDRDELLRATCINLERLFGFRGYRIAAGLVSAALNEPISRSHTRYAINFFRQ
jgi:hypothetical protein